MGGAAPGHQSSIFIGSFSEGLGATGWDGAQAGFSSPRITFSHWLRLFLGQTGQRHALLTRALGWPHTDLPLWRLRPGLWGLC